MLSSELFNVETIITGSLYRICPLFYCNEISSSSDEDIIIDSEVMIVTKKDYETYFNFITGLDDDIIVIHNTNISQLTLFDVGDELSVSEFNAIVQTLRYNNPLSETIRLRNTAVNGQYADYVFDIESTTIIDEGILVTQETLTELGTVTLRNAMYKSSQYYLDLTVKSIDDVNVFDDDTDTTTTTEITVELVENEPVDIPFDTLDFDNVILFDATVRIEHLNSIVQYPTSITNVVNKSILIIGESVTFTCTYKDSSDDPIEGEIIYLKHNNGTSISSSTTDSNGKVTFTYTPDSVGSEDIICVDSYGNKSNLITLTVNNAATSLTLATSKYETSLEEVFTLSGTLTDGNGAGIANQTVKLYVNGTVEGTVTTDSNGAISETHQFNEQGSYALQLKFEGAGIYLACDSNMIGISTFNLLTIVTEGNVTNYQSNLLQNTYGYPITIDYGDETVITYTGSIAHTYTDGEQEHTIRIDGCNKLGNAAFRNNEFTRVTIPDNIKEIPDRCFENNSKLNNITLPESLGKIGNYAFSGIKNCEINIPRNVYQLGTAVFRNVDAPTIILNWRNHGEIIPYEKEIFGKVYNNSQGGWVPSSSLVLKIPSGSKEYYLERGYPSYYLEEY